jgi:hypothetical protein
VIDLNFLAEQNKRLLQELRNIRDELRVNSAMVQRCSNAVTDQGEMLNAIHQWMIGVNERARES